MFLVNIGRDDKMHSHGAWELDNFEELRTDAHVSWGGLMTILAGGLGRDQEEFSAFFTVRHAEKTSEFSWHQRDATDEVLMAGRK